MITVCTVRKVFNQGRPNEYTAVDGVDLSVEMGKVTALKGPSGSGKTTLLTIMGCMSRPTSGRIFLMGKEITSLPERFLTEIRRRTFGFIFQHLNLIKGVTALENVMVPAYPTGERYISLRKRALELFDAFNLAHRATARIEWLSGGEAQRVAIARALINNPEIIIADEPTAHLDTTLSLEFMNIMHGLKEKGKTILIASHDPIVFESDLVDTTLEMKDGRLVHAREEP
jgi:putative ABC transport system ATP-binding protein